MSSLPPGQYCGPIIRSAEAGGIKLTETRHEPHAWTAQHEHQRPYLCYVLRGSFIEASGREVRVCGPGMLIVHPPGEVHSDRFESRGALCFNLELTPEFSDAEAALISKPLALKSGPPRRLIDEVRREMRQADSFSPLGLQSVALELLAWFFRHPRQCRSQAIRALEERLSEADSVRLEEVADELGVCAATLERSFRRELGCSPADFGRRKRLEKAVRLLKSEESIGDIAIACGFYDQSHFTNAFRDYSGLTPLQFRRSLVGN